MFELIILRHGQTGWNVPGQKRVLGRRPIPLNALGQAQVQAVAETLRAAPLCAVYSSPILRTMETAQIVLAGRPSIPLITDEGLAEIDYGDWVDRPLAEIVQRPEWDTYWQRGEDAIVPGGERVRDVQQRAVAVAQRARNEYPEGTVLLVSHADVIKTLLVHYLGASLNDWQNISTDNASISIVRFESDRPRVVRMNCPSYVV